MIGEDRRMAKKPSPQQQSLSLRQWGEGHLYQQGERCAALVDRKSGKAISRIELRTDDGELVAMEDAVFKK